MQRAVEALQRQLAQGEEERSRLKKELSEMAVKAVAVEKVGGGGGRTVALWRWVYGVCVWCVCVHNLHVYLLIACNGPMHGLLCTLHPFYTLHLSQRNVPCAPAPPLLAAQYQQQMQTLEQDRSMLNSRIKELQRMLGDKESDLKGATSSLRQSLRCVVLCGLGV